MKDNFGREITYLRLSVTDKCNLRCRYCMPEEGVPCRSHAEMLTEDEMVSAVEAAAKLGIRKLRITGGEPLVKKNILSICRRCAAVEGIEEVYERGIVLRPNPAWEEVTVESSEPIVGIEVCDLWGREVQSQIVPSATEVVVGVGGLRSGVYIVKVRTSQGCAVRKLVVKRRSEK